MFAEIECKSEILASRAAPAENVLILIAFNGFENSGFSLDSMGSPNLPGYRC